MGYDIEHIKIALRTSNHGGERTEQDRAQADWLRAEIKDLLDDPDVSVVADYQGLDT